MAYDDYFGNVSLLMHCDGSDNSTTFTDVTGKTVTPSGDAKLTTANKQFGSASGIFDGTGDYLTVTPSAQFAFGTGNFTLECWLYLSASNANYARLCENEEYNVANGWLVSLDNSSPKKITFQQSKSGGGGTIIASNSSFPTTTWTHFAVCRSAGVTSLYVAGVKQTATIAADTNNYTATRLRIASDLTAGNPMAANIDDFRITKGVARYTANFDVPTEAFPDVGIPMPPVQPPAFGQFACQQAGFIYASSI